MRGTKIRSTQKLLPYSVYLNIHSIAYQSITSIDPSLSNKFNCSLSHNLYGTRSLVRSSIYVGIGGEFCQNWPKNPNSDVSWSEREKINLKLDLAERRHQLNKFRYTCCKSNSMRHIVWKYDGISVFRYLFNEQIRFFHPGSIYPEWDMISSPLI